MKLIGFSTDEIAGLYTLLGGILHLGNVLFRDVFVDGVDTVDVLNENGKKCLFFTQNKALYLWYVKDDNKN